MRRGQCSGYRHEQIPQMGIQQRSRHVATRRSDDLETLEVSDAVARVSAMMRLTNDHP
jgi:hypothetical protein